MLVIEVFPGIGMLGKGFELNGACVVRGPDTLWGGDIRAFHPPANKFDGVLGGPPCQDFSKKRRIDPTGYGVEMLSEFQRVVLEARPQWWLMENVPGVPDMKIAGYSWQRLDLRASQFGLSQSRLRHFQFGHVDHLPLLLPRKRLVDEIEPCCLASEGDKPNRRSFSHFCTLQGLPNDFQLLPFTQSARYRAVGNGVPIPMARGIAWAIANIGRIAGKPCECGCGRPVSGRARMALPACRKRMERRRRVTVRVS